MIIGLSGWAGSGKDTVGKVIAEVTGAKTMAYADPLREFLEKQNPYVRRDDCPMFLPLTAIIEEYGWDGYKKSPYGGHLRALIQRTGTEAGRGVLGDTVWIDETWKRASNHARVVITDVRFPNEADAVKQHHGIVVRVERPGLVPPNNHPSERSMETYMFDGHLRNDGSIEDLKRKIQPFIG